MNFLGIDLGSSSVKLSLFNADNGLVKDSETFPKQEMEIISKQTNWAEQHPEDWWQNIKTAIKALGERNPKELKSVKSIGIAYQMHGLVLLDKNGEVLRPSIIWCDSRAVEYGEMAFDNIGSDKCLESCLNSPGNFTASKLAWVKENEPEIYSRIDKVLLPGDYVSYCLTGELLTTKTGLSEGIFYDFNNNQVADIIIDEFGFEKSFFPEVKDSFANHGQLKLNLAKEFGINPDVTVTYKAGDQPNNALSLNVMHAGEVAATAGTSGVVYAVSNNYLIDKKSRINSFAHVNHNADNRSIGNLLCVSGTGISYSWMKRNFANEKSYNEINELAQKSEIGAKGLNFYPFGNGAERMFQNKNIGGGFKNISFNIHGQSEIFRAVQEGVAFSFKYGVDIMKELGFDLEAMKVGDANMFLSPLFAQTIANSNNIPVIVYNTDGAQGAARGAAIGAGYYKNSEEAFESLKEVKRYEPIKEQLDQTALSYQSWLKNLNL
jgi:xylulokinase